MRKHLLAMILIATAIPLLRAEAAGTKGSILLQVQSRGEAWYVAPRDGLRYYLGKPQEAFLIMKRFGNGITNQNLQKIPTENSSVTPANLAFTEKHLGKIFLQIESKGEAWYVDPASKKRYYLGRPAEAFMAMKKLGRGITDSDLAKINIGSSAILDQPSTSAATDSPPAASESDWSSIINGAADAFRSADSERASSFFIPTMRASIEYSITNMDRSQLLLLGNILSGSTLKYQTDSKKTYFNELYFQNDKHPVYFYIEKQADGKWLMANL